MYNFKRKSKEGQKTGKSLFSLKGTKHAFKHLPFVYFVGLLTLLYIANVHKAEKKIRTIENLKEEVNEKGWEYQSIKSEVNYKGIQSSTEERVKSTGLQPSKSAPKVIVVEKDE
jgi:uncharacterized pyridoxal phosphate-containing UPF0001 family protein